MDQLTQFVAEAGVIDLAWGHPDPVLLPVAELKAAASRAFDHYGVDALAYGNPAGPPPLREWIGERLAETDARAPAADEVLITAGTSQGLDLLATLVMEPGDVVLASEPTYHLALRILAGDHRFDVRGIVSDEHGVDVDALAGTLATLPRRAGRPAFLYTIPTFSNPTGGSLPDERRRALLDLARGERLVILEDDTYRELAYDGQPPASLWALAGQTAPGTVLRLGTFAKSAAPGLRVGYLTADAATVEHLALSGFLDSGGSPSHFAALVLAEYAAAGDYARVVERFRAGYRERRDALLGALAGRLPSPVSWTRPDGGYFTWLALPDGLDRSALARAAHRHGVGYVPASVFYVDPGRAPTAIRLSFARYSPATLEEAAGRLASALEEVGTPG